MPRKSVDSDQTTSKYKRLSTPRSVAGDGFLDIQVGGQLRVMEGMREAELLTYVNTCIHTCKYVFTPSQILNKFRVQIKVKLKK